MKSNQNSNMYNVISGRLLKRFSETESNKNIVFSPFSVLMLLGILADAADGDARAEVVKAVGAKDYDEFTGWLHDLQKN